MMQPLEVLALVFSCTGLLKFAGDIGFGDNKFNAISLGQGQVGFFFESMVYFIMGMDVNRDQWHQN